MSKQKKFDWAVGDWIGHSGPTVIDGVEVPWSVDIAGEHIFCSTQKEARSLYLKLKRYSDSLAQRMYEEGHGDAMGAVRAYLESVTESQ